MPTAIFDEVQFDPKISYGATGGAGYRTTVLTADSGAETRVGWWLHGKGKWNVSTGVKSRIQMADIQTFHRLRKGKLRGFRFKDWTDYKLVREPFTTTGGVLRLTKTYADGSGQTEVRPIWKPINSAAYVSQYPTRPVPAVLKLYTASSGGTALVEGVAFTLDYATGIVTGLAGGTYYCTGEFDTPVRFDTDDINVNLEDFDVRQWDSIPVVELLLR